MNKDFENIGLRQENTIQDLLKVVRALKSISKDFNLNHEQLVLHEKIIEDPSIDKPNFDRIINAVSICFKVTPAEILSMSRKRERVIARQTCCYLLYYWGDNLEEVAAQMNGMTHGNVSHACSMIRSIIRFQKDIYYPQVIKSFKLIHNQHGRENITISEKRD